ncbi:MAG: hypothetical protein HC788_05835 [Sphingopyxis sp.]|nr:hypothetical protein [Sphingopyxis sp.]
MKRYFLSMSILMIALFGCSNDVHIVPSTEHYLSEPFCWGGDLENRKGKLILVNGNENATIYIVSTSCEIQNSARKNSIIEYVSLLRIGGEESIIREALELSPNTRIIPNYILPSHAPEMQSSVFDVEFRVKNQENNGFEFFELTYLKIDKKSFQRFGDILED